MRSLKEHIYEGLLSGQDATIQSGNEMIKQFNKIKTMICDPKKYERWSRNSYFIKIDDVENVLTFIGLSKQKQLNVSIKKDSATDSWDNSHQFWVFKMSIRTDNYYTDVVIEKSAKGLSFPKFIEKNVTQHFTDIESFKKLIEDQK
jgi:hypothetical protein